MNPMKCTSRKLPSRCVVFGGLASVIPAEMELRWWLAHLMKDTASKLRPSYCKGSVTTRCLRWRKACSRGVYSRRPSETRGNQNLAALSRYLTSTYLDLARWFTTMIRFRLRNQSLLNGPIPRETFNEASALEDLWIVEDEEEIEWREWPLLASDGDMAALIELVSENKVGVTLVAAD